MNRALIAAVSLVFPPAGTVVLRSTAARVLVLTLALVSAAVFFGLWVGPGALLWAATGLLAAVAVLLGGR